MSKELLDANCSFPDVLEDSDLQGHTERSEGFVTVLNLVFGALDVRGVTPRLKNGLIKECLRQSTQQSTEEN